jgi:hypothetical protein
MARKRGPGETGLKFEGSLSAAAGSVNRKAGRAGKVDAVVPG